MKTFIKRDLPNDEYQAAVGANNSSLSNPFATILDLSNIPLGGGSGGTQLLTGGASWSGTGMIFDVTALTYQIAGVNYSSVATSVTLPVGDPTNPRFDAIVVDEFSVVSVISGIPSANPVTPTVPGDQVLVQYVLVGAGQVVPTISDLWVYREDQTGDWVGSAIGGTPQPTAVFNSPTPTPFAGTACLLASYSDYSNSRYIQFLAPSPISRATYVGLSLRVYLLQDLSGNSGRKPFVSLKGPGGVALGGRYLAAHGLNLSLVGVWQQVTIPTALFGANPATLTISSLELLLVPTDSNFGPGLPLVDIAYDNIVFQTGFGTASALPTIDIAQNGTTIGDASKLNFIDGTNTIVTVTDDILNNKVDVSIETDYGPVGIANASGLYTYYADFPTALAAATFGKTIKFFTNITTASTNFTLKDGVDIDLNGHTFETTNSGFSPTDRFITDGVSGPITVNIYNGTLKRNTGENVLRINNTGTVINCNAVFIVSFTGGTSVENFGTINNININALFGYAGQGKLNNAFITSVNNGASISAGGEAFNCVVKTTNGTAILMNGSKLYNCKGYSNNSPAINLSNGTAIDCTGVSIVAIGILATGGYLVGCKGSSNNNVGLSITNSNVSNCYGYSFNTSGVSIFNTVSATMQSIAGYSVLGNGVYLRPNSSGAKLSVSEINGTSLNSNGILIDTSIAAVEIYNVTATCGFSTGNGISTIITQPLLIVGGSISIASNGANCIFNSGITNQIKFGNLTFKVPTGGTAISAGIDSSAVVNTPDIYGNLTINS